MKSFLIAMVGIQALDVILKSICLCCGEYPLKTQRSGTATGLVFSVGFLCWAAVLLFGGP